MNKKKTAIKKLLDKLENPTNKVLFGIALVSLLGMMGVNVGDAEKIVSYLGFDLTTVTASSLATSLIAFFAKD